MRQHFEFPVHQESQCRRLHAPRGPRRLLLATGQALRQSPGRIHSDQPIGERPALRRRRQASKLLARTKRLEAIANRVRRHRLEPEAAYRLRPTVVLDDLVKDQFPLAPGVAGIDETIDILAKGEILDRADSIGVSLLWADSKLPHGQDRQHFQRPGLVLGIDLFRRKQLEEMPHGEGHDVIVVFEVAVVLRAVSEHVRNVRRDARFLRDDERFAQVGSPPGLFGRSHPELNFPAGIKFVVSLALTARTSSVPSISPRRCG